MKKPERWYAFQHECELHDFSISNMSPSSSQQYCARKDRSGRERPFWKDHEYYDQLKCHWNSCPKLKEERIKDSKKEK